MRICPSCGIQVGTENSMCPVCANPLSGEPAENIWPEALKLKKQTVLYKLQLFLLCFSALLCAFLDFALSLNGGIHWSLIVLSGIALFEIFINQTINTKMYAAKFISTLVFDIMLLMLFSGWYAGFLSPLIDIVFPIILCILILTNFILALADKKGNSLVYLIFYVILSIGSYISLFLILKVLPNAAWFICFIFAATAVLAMGIFMGSHVMSEIEKRMTL